MNDSRPIQNKICPTLICHIVINFANYKISFEEGVVYEKIKLKMYKKYVFPCRWAQQTRTWFALL